jgi:hypothetical protein
MSNDMKGMLAGASIINEMRACESIVGKDVFARALATIPPEGRARFTELLPVSWIDWQIVHVVYQAVSKEAGRDLFELQREAISVGLARTFSTVWRTLLRFTTDEAIITRTPLMYSRGCNRGQLTSRIEKPGRAECILADWPEYPLFLANGLAVSIEVVMGLAGRKGASVHYERTADGLRLIATWRP